MPLLQEYIKLRLESNRELTWGELDDNFMYVANPWNPSRRYKEGSIVYYDASITGSSIGVGGLSWWRATVDNGPNLVFNVGEWEAIGASSSPVGDVNVSYGMSSQSVSVIDFNSSNFNVTYIGSTAQIDINGNAVKYWLQPSDPNIGIGDNAADVIHTGDVVIGTGTFPSPYTLAVYGTTNITGNLFVGGTVNSVDILNLASSYGNHTHTAVPTSYPSYAALYPNSISSLEDFDINSGTLANGQTLTWNNSTKKWVNSSPSLASLATLTDTQITSALNNQILIYDNSISRWINATVSTSLSTGLGSPLTHAHDSRYYTQTQLSTSGSGAAIHWNNLTNLPTDGTEYIVSTAPVSPPLNLTNYRVLTSSDSSITIDTSSSNIIDLTVTSVPSYSIDIYNNNVLFVPSVLALDFINTSTATVTVTPVTGSTAEITVDVAADLSDITANGNTTPDIIEITTPGNPSNITPTGGIVLASPSGYRFLITVDDLGNLITTAL
jgi:hypothetical protein